MTFGIAKSHILRFLLLRDFHPSLQMQTENIISNLKAPGSRPGEIIAKLEIYMWLGVTKYVKNSTTELPEEFKPIYDTALQTTRIPSYLPPSQLNRDGKAAHIAECWILSTGEIH